VCGKSADGQVRFVDFGVSLGYDDREAMGLTTLGSVVICEDCTKNVLEVMDYVTAQERDSLVQELEITQGELSVVRQENDRLRNAFDSIISVRPDLNGVAPSDSSDELDQELEGSLDSGAEPDKGFDGSLASGGSEILFGTSSTE
jgi:hypothetical protein